MITVPADFAAGIANLAGQVGRDWVDSLPTVVDLLCCRWGLAVDGPPLHGYLGLVVPVRRGEELCVLKVSWRDESTEQEARALRWWNGAGAVRVLDTDPDHGSLLLERLDNRRTLRSVEISEAVSVAARLLRRLAVAGPSDVPHLREVCQRLAAALPGRWEAAGRPMSRVVLDTARDVARQLGAEAASLLVDFDLHYDNVLAGAREPWLVIDPKVVVGDAEYGVAQLLWTRLEEIQRNGGLGYYIPALVDQAGLDQHRTVSWTLLRCVDYWLWARSAGLSTDPLRCQAIVDHLSW